MSDAEQTTPIDTLPPADRRLALLKESVEWLLAHSRVAYMHPNRRHELQALIKAIQMGISS